ncbi:SusC/RagA family TonB-linked outer membrane protein [Chitinophaga oryziterrae]|uniref:SusC/RagA family TonB-linked outer membrane protein n=1 Tax=Chitinophaga oryziterrae TaxID=1031224 RepID=A0A6N8JBJ7_9BACT|nr:TonB-dependent receptor [Chitinophaga oryziterrae]MVT41502.1 SusC/RagA family TonB-linked outer membrane protein [Chitinophaga oryziterrae]
MKLISILLKQSVLPMLTCTLLLSFGRQAFSQETIKKKFRGTITNSQNIPLEGVTVSIKEGAGTITDASGSFTVEGNEGTSITLSSVGYESKVVVLKGNNPLKIRLEQAYKNLNDVIVVGYGTVKKKDLTGSVAVVNVGDAKKNVSYDVAKMLQGQAAGISVHGSGEPGGYVQIKIRGTTTFGNNSPLFVIDGVPVDAPYDFSPNDIESIQVLKDASAAAIYGSRAATGVIIITTKKGKQGPVRVNFSSYYGTQEIAKKIPVTDRLGYQKIVSAAELNAGLTLAPANDPTNPSFVSSINTDWQNEALKKGVIQDHNVNLSGGSEYVSYNASLGYFNQTGTQTGPQKYDRYTLNSSVQGKKGRFSFGIKTAYTQSHKGNYGATNGHAVFGGTVTSMLTAIPTMPVYDATRLGGYGGSDQVKNRAISANVVGLNNLVNDYSDRNRMLANAWGELEIVKNLKYKLNVSFDRTDYKNFHYEPKFDMGYYYLNNLYYMYQQYGHANTSLIENTLTYQLQAGKHKIDFLGGMTYQEDKNEWMSATATDTTDLNFKTFGAVANANAKGVTSWQGTATMFSLLGRANYNYDDRYLLTFNFRRDGSSKFSPYNRYGNFAGFAAAWNITNEKIFHLPAFISSLKLRGGYGMLGNQTALGYYDYQSYINNATNYLFNNSLATGATTVSVADPSLKWESTTTSNVAIDMGILQEKLTFTVEYFNRVSKDIITAIPIPYSVGSFPQTLTTNAASLKNTGMEFTVNYRNNAGAFNYNISANAYTLKNKVLKLGGTNNPVYGAGSKTEVGREVGELYGFVTEGLFQNASEITKHATQNQSGGIAPGDVKYKDNTGDGAITDADRAYLGSTIPKFYYGLNFSASYKNFDLSFFWQGNAGNKVYNGVYAALMAGQYGNSHVDELRFWTASNTNTNVPRPLINDINNGKFSDRFVESGSYVKLQNAQIGYSIPDSKLTRTKVIRSFRMYVSGLNLLTISKYKGYDPDFISDGLFNRGYDYGSFPNPRTVMVGVQLGL